MLARLCSKVDLRIGNNFISVALFDAYVDIVSGISLEYTRM